MTEFGGGAKYMDLSKKLRFIGFCGVDDSLSPQHLQVISTHYPWIEWGLLFRPDTEGQPRYPSPEWVAELVKINEGSKMNLAGHLCGQRCQEILEGDYKFVQSLGAMGFRRVQVNATAANNVQVVASRLSEYTDNIRSCILNVPEVEWIIQCNEETKPIWKSLVGADAPFNMSMLYDASCGKGIKLTSFPSPLIYPDINCGYAGGIGPDVIEEILLAISNMFEANKCDKSVWIDMESSLRLMLANQNDIFSIDKCFKCIEVAAKFGLTKI